MTSIFLNFLSGWAKYCVAFPFIGNHFVFIGGVLHLNDMALERIVLRRRDVAPRSMWSMDVAWGRHLDRLLGLRQGQLSHHLYVWPSWPSGLPG